MTKMEFPNKPGNVRVDDIEIYIFPDKIIVDTGTRTSRPEKMNQPAYEQRKSKEESGKKPKKDIVNSILDACEDVVMGRTKVR